MIKLSCFNINQCKKCGEIVQACLGEEREFWLDKEWAEELGFDEADFIEEDNEGNYLIEGWFCYECIAKIDGIDVEVLSRLSEEEDEF